MNSKIAIFQTAFPGDLVLTTPLIKSVKKTFPSSKLAIVIRKGNKPLIEELPYIDEIIERDKHKKNIIKLSREIKKAKIDMAISAHRSHRTAITLYLSGVRKRVGFSSSGFSFLYNIRVPYNGKKHEIERNLDLLRYAINNPVVDKSPELIVNDDFYHDTLKMFNLKEKSYMIISPGSVWKTKRWIPEYFARTGEYFEKRGIKVVITGTQEESKLCNFIHSLLNKATNLCGKTSLKQLMAIIKGAAISITNDSAPAHISSAFNTPVIAIFGPTVKEFGFYPVGRKSRVAEVRNLPCRPCSIHGGEKCPEKHFKCMTELKPEHVIEIAKNLLDEV